MIVTTYVRPPVPTNQWDWMAYIEGDEEGPTGRGPTEAEALRDLCEQLAAMLSEKDRAMNRTDDEYYVGTGPAVEVGGAGQSREPSAVVAGGVSAEAPRPTYTELLAQRDELASLVQAYMERDELARITNSALYVDASAALSRIKRA